MPHRAITRRTFDNRILPSYVPAPVFDMRILPSFILLVCAATTFAAGPQASLPKGYLCYRTAGSIVIDGQLNERAWRRANWTDYFVDIGGDRKDRPRFRTRLKMLWDDTCLYVGANLEEPHVWGTLTGRDTDISQDDDFEIFVDPDGDNHDYCEVDVNALNAVRDLLLKKPLRDGGSPMTRWDIAGLRTAVHVSGTRNNPADVDRGWSVEIAIPWSSLRELAHRAAPPREGDQWRLNFRRVEWTEDIVDGTYKKNPGMAADSWVWSPQGVVDMHAPEHWGYVQFTRRRPGTAALTPDPAARARQLLCQVYYAEHAFHDSTKRWASTAGEMGLSIKALDLRDYTPAIELTPEGFVATVMLRSGGRVERWHIRQDSLLWRE